MPLHQVPHVQCNMERHSVLYGGFLPGLEVILVIDWLEPEMPRKIETKLAGRQVRQARATPATVANAGCRGILLAVTGPLGVSELLEPLQEAGSCDKTWVLKLPYQWRPWLQ